MISALLKDTENIAIVRGVGCSMVDVLMSVVPANNSTQVREIWNSDLHEVSMFEEKVAQLRLSGSACILVTSDERVEEVGDWTIHESNACFGLI